MGKEHPRGVPPTDIAAVYLEDLADPKEVGNVPRRMDHTDVLARCAALLETHREPYNPRSSYAEQPSPVPSYSAAEVLQTCIPLRYAFVLKTLAYVEPSALRPGAAGCPERSVDADSKQASSATASCRVFDGGFRKADVLVYDVLSGVPLGGFRVAAESPTSADVGESAAPQSILDGMLEGAFESAYSKAMLAADKY